MKALTSPLPQRGDRYLYGWLCLAVASLVGAGLFAGLVAMARTPLIQDYLPGGDYLQGALVGHVILAIVVWFLVFQGGLWTLAGNGGSGKTLGGTGFWAAVLGSSILVMPAILGWGRPVLANYVPVLTHPWFITGLLLFSAGIGMAALAVLWTVFRLPRPVSLLAFGSAVTAGIVITALLCFGVAAFRLTTEISSGTFFDDLVWGGGHVLQFSNTAAMVLVWLLLARRTLGAVVLEDRWAKMLLSSYLILALPAPFFYLGPFPGSEFTLLMAIGLGPATCIIALALIRVFVRRIRAGFPWADPGFSSLGLSLAVFAFGGMISILIRGNNVIIPAHYHGVIGGVTLAFMGLSYHLLPCLGRKIWSPRLARIQPYCYGLGQTLFVLGLLWAGVHGAPRKTFGAAQGLNQTGEIYGMVLMGLGGLVAIFGGIAFILNMVPSLVLRTGSGTVMALPLWRKVREGGI